ncbi:MAG TPA: S41 family peptidase [Rhizomicrobium sp.]|nr:S41 family peptidase [Rhizomicrobium sp.]
MKRYVIAGVGALAGFAAGVVLLPAAQSAADNSAYKQLDLFGDAFERVRANYVRPVKDSELINNAIEGMVSSLDPHSSYMDAKAYADMKIQTQGQFGGLGLEVTMDDGLVKVISPIDDTPAAKAGVKPGDYIAAIDNTPVQGMTLNDATDRMRGAPGSKVKITILRKGEKKPFDLTLTRAIVHVASVKFHREGDIGYIRLSAFNEEAASGVENAVKQLQKQIGPNIKGYILDLRNNPGGLLDEAIDVSDDFLQGGTIVSTKGRHSSDDHVYDAHGGDVTDGKPIIVLINQGTASAAEIVAGALQDDKRAQILGMTSFGKGSVQTIIPLSAGGGALRLTTARYYTPSGHSIQALGITPNIMVAQGDEPSNGLQDVDEADLPGHLQGEAKTKKPTQVIKPAPGKKYDDFQLSYALDVLRGKNTVAFVKSAMNAD